MATTQDIVAKLWNLCNILRDDGVHYSHYVTELTYLLFLKMLKETGQETLLPKNYRWDDVTGKSGIEQFNFYRSLLVHLGNEGRGLEVGPGLDRQATVRRLHRGNRAASPGRVARVPVPETQARSSNP